MAKATTINAGAPGLLKTDLKAFLFLSSAPRVRDPVAKAPGAVVPVAAASPRSEAERTSTDQPTEATRGRAWKMAGRAPESLPAWSHHRPVINLSRRSYAAFN